MFNDIYNMIIIAIQAEKRDGYNLTHMQRVGHYTYLTSTLLGFDEETSLLYGIISMVHDIGKLFVPKKILNCKRRLTTEEKQLMSRHTEYGVEIAQKILLPHNPVGNEVISAIKYHHEWWNGKGYPEGISENKIPFIARIVAVCDVFDALIHPRAYKSSWKVEEAHEYIITRAGTQFDPCVVEAFSSLMKDPLKKKTRFYEAQKLYFMEAFNAETTLQNKNLWDKK